jgi:hypothetical protein
MNLTGILARLIPDRWRRRPETPSAVMLLRQENHPSEEVLRLAAERAWGIRFEGGEDSPHFVMQNGDICVMKAGPFMLTVVSFAKPYLDRDPAKLAAEWLPQPGQRSAWSEHTAWTAINWVAGAEGDTELVYCVLAKLAAELLNANCAGIYWPRERSFHPNDGSTYEDLQKLAGSRDPGIR